jgi:hypothetical protein
VLAGATDPREAGDRAADRERIARRVGQSSVAVHAQGAHWQERGIGVFGAIATFSGMRTKAMLKLEEAFYSQHVFDSSTDLGTPAGGLSRDLTLRRAAAAARRKAG